MRDFTGLHFRYQSLDAWDYIFLLFFWLLGYIPIIADLYGYDRNVQSVISTFLCWQVCYTAFGIRFRNFYFSAIWLAGCINICILNYDAWLFLAPLLHFILYQIIRKYHWENHEREFVPSFLSGGRYTRIRPWKSDWEKRDSDQYDRNFSALLAIAGTLILAIYAVLTLSQVQ